MSLEAPITAKSEPNSQAPELGEILPETLSKAQLQALAQSLIERISLDAQRIEVQDQNIQAQSAELQLRQTRIDALTFEIRLLRHLRFCAKTEAMDAVQVKLFEEANAEDLADAQQRLTQLDIRPAPVASQSRPARQRLPASLPRVDIAHEPQTPPAPVVRP
jgi:hypothetical protein